MTFESFHYFNFSVKGINYGLTSKLDLDLCEGVIFKIILFAY